MLIDNFLTVILAINCFYILVFHYFLSNEQEYKTFIIKWHFRTDIFFQLHMIKILNTQSEKVYLFITYANKFPYIILLTATDQYFSISGV